MSETPNAEETPAVEGAAPEEPPKKPLKERLVEKLKALVQTIRQKIQDKLKKKPQAEGATPAAAGKVDTLFRASFSNDWSTRKMGTIFVASLLGLALVTTISVRRYLYLRHLHQHQLSLAEQERKKLGEFFERRAEEARDRLSWIELGRYTFETVPLPVDEPAAEKKRHIQSIRSLAEIELSAKCNDRATSEYIEARMTQARNEVTSALAGVEKEELMSPEGKRRMKKRIVDRLNAWIAIEFPKGKVDDVFFSSLIVS